MTTATEAAIEHAEEYDEHISDWGYVKVALLLAAITALEVFTYFDSVVDWGSALIPALLVMMVCKFGIVAAYFMHLKFDSPMFTRLFVSGICFAVVVYIIMLLTFGLDAWEIFQD